MKALGRDNIYCSRQSIFSSDCTNQAIGVVKINMQKNIFTVGKYIKVF